MWSPIVGAISLSLLVLNVCWDITTVGSPNKKLHSNTEVRHSKEGGQGELRVGTRQDDTMAELWEYIGQHPATVSGPRPLRQTWRRRTPDVVRRWSRWNVHTDVPMFSLHSLGNSTSQSFNTPVTHTSSNKRPRSTSSSIPVSAFSSAFSSRPSSRPSSTFSSRPSSTFSSTFSSRPSSTFSSRPSSTFSSRPSSTFSSRPSSTFSSRPSSTFSSRPSSTFSSRPSSTFSSRPSSTFSSRPSSRPSSTPSSTFSSRPSSRPSSTFSSRPSSTFPTTSSLPKARRLVTVEPGYLLVMTKARPSKGGADPDDLIFVPETEQVRVDSLQETSLKKGADSDEEQSASEKPLVLPPFSKTTDKGKTPSWTSKSNSSNFNNVSKFYGYINNKVNDEAGVTPAVTRVTLMARTTSPLLDGDGGEGGRAAVDVSETVITRNSERPATPSGTEDSISSAVFIADLPGRTESSARVALPFDTHRPGQRQDFMTLPLDNHTSSQRQDYVTLPPDNHTSSQRQDYVTLPPNNHTSSERQDYVTLPPNSHTSSQRQDYVTLPPNSHTSSQRQDYVTLPLDNQSLGAEAYMTSLPRQLDVTVHRRRRQVDTTDTTTFSGTDELRFCNTTTDKEDPESAALISVGIYPALLTGTSHRVRTSRYGVALAADSMFTKIVLRIPLDASSVIRPFAGTDRCGEQMNRPCS